MQKETLTWRTKKNLQKKLVQLKKHITFAAPFRTLDGGEKIKNKKAKKL